ncbi:hypothetical protein [Sphingosinicella sp.]|uniref:hypothetical protein n=1 Tax=Sphingosinicella sp. TaxID=1917971 RepID=UPI0040383C6B
MTRLTDLGFLFRVVAIVELAYALIGLLTPPYLVFPITGWVLSPDGHWIAKLLAIALASQAWVAWILRNEPHPGVALAFALYQVGSATADWVIWLTMADEGVFATASAQAGIIISIPTHYLIGALLLVAAYKATRPRRAYG